MNHYIFNIAAGRILMVVSYDKLWKLMKDNKLKKKDLVTGLS